ncbi:MAG: GAF domain-containing protein, partial [Deltaproteobacteria bacterium]|nr:GAF domain-containing protein [Deltaproteobacteria bacterium]
MSGELIPLGPAPQQPVTPSPSLRQVLSGYRLASYGLVKMGRGRVDVGVRQLEAGEEPDVALSLAALAAQEVDRRAGDWVAASEQACRASELMRQAGSPTSAGIALALGVESLVIAGRPAEAEQRMPQIDGGAGGEIWLDAANAMLQLAQGHVSEARTLLRRLPEADEGAWTGWWARLLQAEVLLEMGALVGAAEPLDLLATALPRSARFTEANTRYLQLRAWLAIARVWSNTKPAQHAELRAAADAAVSRLAGYAQNHPYYRAWARQFRGELRLLERGDPEADFSAASADLQGIGAPFARARLLSRQALQLRAAERRWNEQRVGEARAVLLDLGLPGRVGALSAAPSGGPAAPAANTAVRKSIAVRLEGSLENMNLTEESGLEAIIEVSRYLSSILEVDLLLEKILESVVRVMRAERGALLRHRDDGALECVAVKGLAREDVVEGSNEISFGVIREVERGGEPVLTDNALEDERFRERKSVMATDIRSVLCSPIRTRQRSLGYIYLDRRLVSLPFTLEQQDLLAAFCTQAAVAWENALSFQQIETLNVGLE